MTDAARALTRRTAPADTGRVICPDRTPTGEGGPARGREEYDRSVMASSRDDLDRILTSPYLDGIHDRSLEEIRAMRTECQQAEVGLSYLRRLIQGRLDIVHSYIDHLGSNGPLDLATLVEDLPGILSSGPGRPPGPGHLPMLLAPDTEESDLTADLDVILGADEIASLADMDIDHLRDLAGRLEALENKVSLDRRALHLRIDTLQAELVERHKTGRASVDGLLS